MLKIKLAEKHLGTDWFLETSHSLAKTECDFRHLEPEKIIIDKAIDILGEMLLLEHTPKQKKEIVLQIKELIDIFNAADDIKDFLINPHLQRIRKISLAKGFSFFVSTSIKRIITVLEGKKKLYFIKNFPTRR